MSAKAEENVAKAVPLFDGIHGLDCPRGMRKEPAMQSQGNRSARMAIAGRFQMCFKHEINTIPWQNGYVESSTAVFAMSAWHAS
ncbi:hypothetical protein CA13_55140 [Planctomycetes bacterium CA13]|uniref:Uncharacterized protein n=1 Tax=Novipirellula herctigrandis TaxID=2527986 RepID=A0A5C5ZA07_9BACT|nr:hypothetical protein CA13_55140 [Planctomycetes bacterium CA13]